MTQTCETLALAGSRTVATAEETRSAIMAGLAAGDGVTIDCAAITEADLTVVQALLAARLSASRSGKEIVLTGVGAGALAPVLDEAGINREDPFWQG